MKRTLVDLIALAEAQRNGEAGALATLLAWGACTPLVEAGKSAPAAAMLPHWGRMRCDYLVDQLAGSPMPPPITLPVELTLVRRALFFSSFFFSFPLSLPLSLSLSLSLRL